MLRPIRDDLNLYAASSTSGGCPAWTIHDPVRNKFFQIEWRVFEVLRRWDKGTAERVSKAVNLETTLSISADFVKQIEVFLFSHQLCRVEDLNSTNFVANTRHMNLAVWAKWLLHHYLFFRIPLIKPDKFLTNTLPYLSFLYSRYMFWVLCFALFLGLFLVAKQWDVFLAEFVDLFSIRGLVFFGFTLILVKILHELGHAYTAKLYGCRVPTMGVAFLVLWPMFYTDTNESWKLSSRQKRLHIAAAGVIVELSIAVFATLAWSFCPPGVFREAIFMAATTTWISSVLINASPFMRFDGYYLLSDFWRIPNLHERSFEIARWWVRAKLFDLDEPPKEKFEFKKRNLLIIFAFCVWIYRLFLFVGIAILVYSFFTKVIGLFLFIVEIWWFILRPLCLEFSEWSKRKKAIFSRNRVWFVTLLFIASMSFLFVPWRSSITTHGVIESRPYNVVYSQYGGRLEVLPIKEGQYIEKGQLIAKLSNPKYSFDYVKTFNQILIQKELQKLASIDPGLRSEKSVITSKIVRLETELSAAREKISALSIYSPISGQVTDVTRGLSPLQWLGNGQRLAAIKGDSWFAITGYIFEEDIERTHKDGTCKFSLLNKLGKAFDCKIVNIAHSVEEILQDQVFASKFGGNISTRNINSQMVPDKAIYKVTAKLLGKNVYINQEALGILRLEADSKNVIERFWRWGLGVIIRESGM